MLTAALEEQGINEWPSKLDSGPATGPNNLVPAEPFLTVRVAYFRINVMINKAGDHQQARQTIAMARDATYTQP